MWSDEPQVVRAVLQPSLGAEGPRHGKRGVTAAAFAPASLASGPLEACELIAAGAYCSIGLARTPPPGTPLVKPGAPEVTGGLFTHVDGKTMVVMAVSDAPPEYVFGTEIVDPDEG